MLIGRLMWAYYQQISNCCRPVLTFWLTDLCHQRLTDCWSCTAFCSLIFFCYSKWLFMRVFIWLMWTSLWQWIKYCLFYQTNILKQFFWVASITFLSMATDISQGSVATRLRCNGIFKYELVANLPVSLPVKEFWKSVDIWGSYGQEFGVLFFSETQCTIPV